MKKTDFLRAIAERAYDIGFGAKKHFATYDIIEKIPGWIGFSSISFGIVALAYEDLSTKAISVILIILGVVSLYVGLYVHQKQQYEDNGKLLTDLFYELKNLYLKAKGLDETQDFSNIREQFSDIEKRFLSCGISKQILFSNWYAHYKFFWELQIGWVDEQLKFSFFRDKVPLSLWLFIFVLLCLWLVLGCSTWLI